MDRDRAHRLLADVVNLTDGRAEAAADLEHAETRVDRVREAAERRCAAIEASVPKLAARLADIDERLAAAREQAAAVPPDLAQEVLADLASRRNAKEALLSALASAPIAAPGGDDVAALAERAGISIASAGSAGAAGQGGLA